MTETEQKDNKIIPLISLGWVKEVAQCGFCFASTANVFLCIFKFRGETFCIPG